jgi:hypothetical protein
MMLLLLPADDCLLVKTSLGFPFFFFLSPQLLLKLLLGEYVEGAEQNSRIKRLGRDGAADPCYPS